MADPTKYVPAYSYSGWQATNPTRPLPADEVDNDLANVSRSVNETIDALKQIRRSDGKLANQSVGPDQLSPALTIGFTFTGMWVDGRSYSAGDGVVKDDTFYSAKVAHTADVSNAPGNDAYWNELYSLNDIVVTGGMALPRDSFVGDGTTTAFTLSFVPLSKFNLFVQVGGVVQSTDAYSSNGNTLTFASPPPNGYGIEVRGFATVSALVTPEDGSVSTAKLADLAVTTPKLADEAVTTPKMADGSATTPKIADGAVTTPKIADHTVTTAKLADVASLADYADLAALFASGAKEFIIPAGLGAAKYAATTAITIPAGSRVRMDPAAGPLKSTYNPAHVGDANNYAQFTIGAGAKVDNFIVHLDTGPTAGYWDVKQVVWVENFAQVGYVKVTSQNFNVNRTLGGSGVDDIAGAVLLRGNLCKIGTIEIDNFDAGLCAYGADYSDIRYVKATNCGYSVALRNTKFLSIGSVYATGATDAVAAAATTAFGLTARGRMTPGYNSLLLNGAEGARVNFVTSVEALEHGVRIGATYSNYTGTVPSVTNKNIRVGTAAIYRAFGTGWKQDDADASLIDEISIGTLYTEDIGQGVWGDPNYADGNRQALAIRNSQWVQIGSFMNRARTYADSGQFGCWLEKSLDVTIGVCDTENSRLDGILLQTNGVDMERILIASGRSVSNGQDGVRIDNSAANSRLRAIKISVSSELNTGYGVNILNRPDTLTDFAGQTTHLDIVCQGNTAGVKNIPTIDETNTVFIDEIRTATLAPLTGSATFDPASLADGAGVTTTVTVTGAALGDFAEASFSQALQGVLVTAWVSAANTVSVRFQNETGGVLDLASGTLRARVRKL